MTKQAFPGLAIYHEGMDLVAVVSTGSDVWFLQVTGQLMNESWSNIGVKWGPYKDDEDLRVEERGGLEVRSTFLLSTVNIAAQFSYLPYSST